MELPLRRTIGLLVLLAGIAWAGTSVNAPQGGQGATPFGWSLLDEGTVLGVVKSLNFTGSGVTCTIPTAQKGQCAISGGGGGASGFDAITTGINTTATMTCSTGCSIVPSGSGTINATAFATNPLDCSANQYATTIAANGNLTCAQVGYAQLSGVPSTFTPSAHNFLDSTVHNNTLTGTPVAGDLITANSTPAWTKLALGAAKMPVTVNSGGTALTESNVLACRGGGTGIDPGGTPSCATGFDNLSPLSPSVKGQLITMGAGTSNQSFGVGADGTLLHADSSQTLGLRWGSVADAELANQYFLLAGRSGGQIGNGGTAASDSLTLKSSSSGLTHTGGVLIPDNVRIGDTTVPAAKLELAGVADFMTTSSPKSGTIKNVFLSVDLSGTNTGAPMYPLRFFPNGFTSASGNTELVNIDSTMTCTNGSYCGLVGFGFIPTLKNPTTQPSSGISFGYSYRPTFTVDGSTFDLSGAEGGSFGFWGHPNFTQQAGAGAGTLDRHSTVMSHGTLNTGWTIGTYAGLWMKDLAGSGGTITTQVGIDLESMTRGTNKFSLRSTGAQTMQHEGGVRIGSPSVLPTARLDVMQPSGSTATPVVDSGWNNANYTASVGETRTGYVVNDTFTLNNNTNSSAQNQTNRGFVYEPTATASGQQTNDVATLFGYQFNPTVTGAQNTVIEAAHMSGTYTASQNPFFGFVTAVAAGASSTVFGPLLTLTSTTTGVPPFPLSAFVNNATSKYDVASGTATSANALGFTDNQTVQNVQAGGSFTVTQLDSFTAAPKITQTAGTMTVTARRGFRCNNIGGSGSPTITTNTCVDLIDQTKGTTINGIASAITAAAGKFFLNDTGGAQSSFVGKFTKYNNDTTAGNGVPGIVGTVASTNVSTVTGTTTLFTAPAAGLYRVTGLLVTTATQAGADVITLTLGWTDDNSSARTATTTCDLTVAGSTNTVTQAANVKSGATITWATTQSGAIGTGRYSVYVSVERLI